jgi:predicted ATPase
MIQLVQFLDFSILYGHAYSTELSRVAGAIHRRLPYLENEGPIFDAFSKLVLYRVKDYGTEDQRNPSFHCLHTS